MKKKSGKNYVIKRVNNTLFEFLWLRLSLVQSFENINQNPIVKVKKFNYNIEDLSSWL